jgi:hypothetical protein
MEEGKPSRLALAWWKFGGGTRSKGEDRERGGGGVDGIGRGGGGAVGRGGHGLGTKEGGGMKGGEGGGGGGDGGGDQRVARGGGRVGELLGQSGLALSELQTFLSDPVR